MNKGQYRAARRLIRENGIYALRWMDDDTAPIMDVLASQHDDQLKTRAALDLLARYNDRKAAHNG